MPTAEQMRAMSPAQRAVVYRRRRIGVGAVAVALVLLIVLGAGSFGGEDASEEVAVTTTVPAPPSVGTCRAPEGLRERLAGLVMIGVDPDNPAAAVAVLASNRTLGGVFVGGDSGAVLGDAAFRQATADAELLVAVDDEGGRVQRLDFLAGRLASARSQARNRTPAQVREAAEARGEVMAQLGINVDLAPVVDVSTQADGDVIGDRSFGGDARTVTAYAGAFAEGLRRAGVLPVLKHFPGHGRASGDSHDGAVLAPRLADLRKVDLVPYGSLLDAEPVAVMTGHLDVPDLTEEGRPASLSPATYRLLRDDLGFDGMAMTDDLAGMAAVTARFPPPEAAVVALTAGADLALLSSVLDPAPVLDRLVAAVEAGRLSRERVDEAWTRVVKAKASVGAISCGD